MSSKGQASRSRGSGELFESQPDRRLFLGIWPGASATVELVRLMERLQREKIIPGRMVDPDRLHVTLLHLDDFVGQVPSSLLPVVRAAVASMPLASFHVTFDRVCCTPRHVLLFSSQELIALKAFQARLRSALITAGLSTLISPRARRAMGRPFNPHVTLSYNPGNATEAQVARLGWDVQEFHLVESLLGQHKHVRLDSWSLYA